MDLCPCRILIPTAYNDGKAIEPEKLARIFQALDRQFGGFNVSGVQGSWFGQVEESIRVEIAITEDRVKELETVVHAIGRELEQEAMYFEVPPPSARIVEIKKEE